MEKMKRTAKILDMVFRVMFWTVVVLGALFIVGSILMLIMSDKIYTVDELNGMRVIMSINGIYFDNFVEGLQGIDVWRLFTGAGVLALFAMAFLLYGIYVVRQVLKPMKNGNPFDGSVSQNFKKLGWLSLAYGVAQVVISSAGRHMLLRALTGTGVSNVGVETQVDLTFLVVAGLLLLFAYIFRYGEELQRLSDETL